MRVLQQTAQKAETVGATWRVRVGHDSRTRIVANTFLMVMAPYLGIQAMAAVVDPDIWWHIRTGDWIAQHHAVPRFAIFSQYSDRAWVAYSWAFELALSVVHHASGLAGLPASLICIQILISLCLLMAMERIRSRFWPSWCIAAAAIYAIYGIPLRPMALTFLFFIFELWLIFEVERGADSKLLLCMGPLFLAWANIHIQFVYGLFVLGLYAAAQSIPMAARKWSGHDVGATFPTMPILALFVAIGGSCIGPNWTSPYQVALDLVMHPVQNQGIVEMAAMNFRRPEHYARVLLVMAAAFALGRSGRRGLFRPLLLAATAAVSFRFMRDAWFVSIAAAFVLADAIPPGHAEPEQWRPSRTRVAAEYALAAALAFGLSFGFALRESALSPSSLMAVIDRVYPVRATEFIRDSRLSGPMYNSFNWGGFLILNLPSQPVSIDPRVNIYGDSLVQQAFRTVNAVGWRSDPVLARANFVVLERWSPLASALASDAGYRLAYQDELACVFVRNRRISGGESSIVADGNRAYGG